MVKRRDGEIVRRFAAGVHGRIVRICMIGRPAEWLRAGSVTWIRVEKGSLSAEARVWMESISPLRELYPGLGIAHAVCWSVGRIRWRLVGSFRKARVRKGLILCLERCEAPPDKYPFDQDSILRLASRS